MGLAGAVREAAAVAPAVAAAVAVNGGGGGGGEWPSAIAIDGSLGVTLALVALALECALFAAVIVQTASTEPGTHVPLSRSFTLLFGLTAATAGLTAVTTLFGSSSAIAHAAATAACACLAGATLGTLPAAAAVVFPEAHRGTEKTAAFVAGIAAVAAGVAAVTGAGIGAGVVELLPVGGGVADGGAVGGRGGPAARRRGAGDTGFGWPRRRRGACRRCVGWRGGRRAVDVGGTPLPSHGRCVPHHVPLPPGL